jgi:hypothetical protein
MKITDALYVAAEGVRHGGDCSIGVEGKRSAETICELLDAPFPCGYPEALVHDAVPGVRSVTIECAAGMLSPDEARGIIADLLRAIDQAER